jgi:hypothetical protein
LEEGMVMKGLGPGPSSVAGLEWLARVGAASLEAWSVAAGWGQSVGYHHAQRLREKGWIERAAMTHGRGALFFATRTGVQVSGVKVRALAGPPSAVTWPHAIACAWTAAWLTARGREMIGPREILKRWDWRGELLWHEHGETRRRSHRPDLAGRLPSGEVLPIEVELSEKSAGRLAAVLGLYASWIRDQRTPAVIYICRTSEVADCVRAAGRVAGLTENAGTIRIELLDTIRRQASDARGSASGSSAEAA